TLFYGVRTEADLAFHKLLEHFATRHPQFKYYPILSHDPNWPGEKGFLNFEFVQGKLGTIQNQIFYICGPEVMALPLLDKLEAHSVPEEHIHIEQFVSADAIDDSQIPE